MTNREPMKVMQHELNGQYPAFPFYGSQVNVPGTPHGMNPSDTTYDRNTFSPRGAEWHIVVICLMSDGLNFLHISSVFMSFKSEKHL